MPSSLEVRREKAAVARQWADEAGLCRRCRSAPRVANSVSCAKCLDADRARQCAYSDATDFQSGAREFWEAKAEGREPLNPHLRESPEYRAFESGLREATHASEIMSRADIRQEIDADGNVRNIYRRKPSRAGGRPRKG
jgi:hypothetical protein